MPEFILPLLWPPNSPDLNPVDYSVWNILQEKVYKTRITNFDDLKHHIRTEWAKLDHAVIAAAVRQWRLQGRRWSFRALLLILAVCFCDNCGLWSLRWLVKSNCCRLIFRPDFLAVVSYDVVCFNTWRSFNSQGKVVTLIRCGGLFCVSLVSHYLNDIPFKNYNYVFVFVKVMPKILLVPFFQTRCSYWDV